MSLISAYLPEIWLGLIGFFLLYYAITDGSDLGVGVISLFAPSESERGLMMSTLHSTWHNNQTWLVLLGGMLFGAFPLFYSLVLSSLYIPILLMLFGLIFRGISFDFRESSENKVLWGRSFSWGSLLTALSQGFGLGGLLQGLHIAGGKFHGSVWGWLSPFAALVAVGVVIGYVMLGANYLIMKTSGELQRRFVRWSAWASLATLAISALIHGLILLKYPHVLAKWTTMPDALPLISVLSLAVICFVMLYLSLWRRRETAPLFWNAGIILFSFIALSVGMYPDMIPNGAQGRVTVYDAAASPSTLTFMLVVTAILIPIILSYTAYEFWVFRGKTEDEHYGGGEG